MFPSAGCWLQLLPGSSLPKNIYTFYMYPLITWKLQLHCSSLWRQHWVMQCVCVLPCVYLWGLYDDGNPQKPLPRQSDGQRNWVCLHKLDVGNALRPSGISVRDHPNVSDLQRDQSNHYHSNRPPPTPSPARLWQSSSKLKCKTTTAATVSQWIHQDIKYLMDFRFSDLRICRFSLSCIIVNWIFLLLFLGHLRRQQATAQSQAIFWITTP